MKAIRTIYKGPDKMIAEVQSWKFAAAYDRGLDMAGNHQQVAASLKAKLGWSGTMFGGSLPDGSMAWVVATGPKI